MLIKSLTLSIVLCLLDSICVNWTLQCLNHNNNVVPWWFLLKHHKDFQNFYFDEQSIANELELSHFKFNDINSSVRNTLNQV